MSRLKYILALNYIKEVKLRDFKFQVNFNERFLTTKLFYTESIKYIITDAPSVKKSLKQSNIYLSIAPR